MFGKILEAALKIAFTAGVKEIQKNQLKNTASKDGEIIDNIPCSLRRSGQFLFQQGMVSITKKSIHFRVLGKQPNLTGKELIPINEFTYEKTTFKMLTSADAISLNYNAKTYLFVFSNGKRDLFENAIQKARGNI